MHPYIGVHTPKTIILDRNVRLTPKYFQTIAIHKLKSIAKINDT